MRNHLFNTSSRIVRMADGPAGGGGFNIRYANNTHNNNNQNTNNNQNNSTNNKQGNEQDNTNKNNATSIDLDDPSIWQDKPKNNENNNQNNNNQNNNNNGNGNNNANNTEGFDNYVKNLVFDVKLPEDAMAKLQKGDLTWLSETLQDSFKAVYRQAIVDSTKLSQNMSERAINEAVNKAGTNVASQRSIDFLEQQIPIAAKPAVKPVAQGVFQQALRRGQTQAEAAETVKQFFKAVRSQTNDQFNLPDDDNSGQRRFGSNQDQEVDWLEWAKTNS